MLPSLDFLLSAETAVVASIVVAILVGFVRMKAGGEFWDEKRFVPDGIAGVSLLVLTLLWYGIVFDQEVLLLWVTKPVGKLAVSGAIANVLVSRMRVIIKSCTNK